MNNAVPSSVLAAAADAPPIHPVMYATVPTSAMPPATPPPMARPSSMPESPSSPVDPSPGPSHTSDGSRHVSLAQMACSLEGVSLRAATGSRRGAYQLRASNGVIHAKRLVKVGVVAAGGRIDAHNHRGDVVVFLLPTETWVVLVEPVRRVATPRGRGFAEVHPVVAAAGPVPPVVVRCKKGILGVCRSPTILRNPGNALGPLGGASGSGGGERLRGGAIHADGQHALRPGRCYSHLWQYSPSASHAVTSAPVPTRGLGPMTSVWYGTPLHPDSLKSSNRTGLSSAAASPATSAAVPTIARSVPYASLPLIHSCYPASSAASSCSSLASASSRCESTLDRFVLLFRVLRCPLVPYCGPALGFRCVPTKKPESVIDF